MFTVRPRLAARDGVRDWASEDKNYMAADNTLGFFLPGLRTMRGRERFEERAYRPVLAHFKWCPAVVGPLFQHHA
ncbi:hypothetical protein ACLOJK_009926 [Asimina triloba]